MKNYKIELSFIRDVLGSQPSNEELKKKYILNKMMTGKTGASAEIAMTTIQGEIDNLKADANYQDSIKDIQDKQLTVFFRDKNGLACISDVQVRGFFKDAFSFIAKENKWLTKKDGSNYSGGEHYRKFIGERIAFKSIYFNFLDEIDMDIYERPIRVMTMQGPRVSLASSERIKAPQRVIIEFMTTDDVKEEYIEKSLERGLFKGLGQFSNAQWGTFTFKIL